MYVGSLFEKSKILEARVQYSAISLKPAKCLVVHCNCMCSQVI